MKKSKIEELLKLIEGQDEAFATFEKARDLLLPLEEVHFLASMTTMFKAYGIEHHTTRILRSWSVSVRYGHTVPRERHTGRFRLCRYHAFGAGTDR